MTSLSSVLQDERISRVMQSFVTSFDSFSNIDSDNLIYIPLRGGGSKAALYRFDIGQSSYVLRLLAQQASNFTRMHQIILAKQAGKIRIGPEIHFVDSQMEAMIMNFIPGRTVQQKDFEDCDNLIQFAKFLQKLHSSKESFPVACSPFQRFQNFLLKGKQEKITYPSRFIEVKTLMEELEATFQLSPVPQVPTHLDLHPLNIMLSEQRFFLVDWVNGGICDPYFDLATFATFQCLDESQTLTFLTHYFERPPNQFEWNRFIITQPIRMFVIAAALLNTSIDETRPLSYEEALKSWKLPSITDFGKNMMNEPLWPFGLTMLKSGLQLIDQRNFKTALRYIQEHLFSFSFK
jgi:thiamine kinase-like enzyme